MLSPHFIWMALAVTIFGNLFYIRDTLQGNTRPNRVSFFLWGTTPLITFIAQHAAGGGEQSLYTLVVAIIPLFILGASFADKEAYWEITKFDLICGCISLIAVAFLLLTRQPLLSLFLSVVGDFFAGIPTIIKSCKYPETETALAYAFDIGSSLIILLTVHQWRFVNYFFAAYVLFMNITFTALLVLSPRLQRQIRRSETL